MLPEDIVKDLQQAVEALNVDTTHELIDRIRQQNEPLANALAELVNNYRFDRLQELFEKMK